MLTDQCQNISTFAVLDLETNGLPWQQFNKCSITELSIYAFSAQCIKDEVKRDVAVLHPNECMEGVKSFACQPPELPRILHKLTLMVNPRAMVHPEAERITGLSNDTLCNEPPFDENTANSVLLFLERLKKPICLVAHNGWSFDFPVLQHVFHKLNMCIPSSVYCVDSLKAFIEIDEKQAQLEEVANSTVKHCENNAAADVTDENEDDTSTTIRDPLQDNCLINWQEKNETTPHRKTKTQKRKRDIGDDMPDKLNPGKRVQGLSVRRELFSKPFQPKSKYPPKGKYKLGNIYERVFMQPHENLHRAETDVMILTKLLLHYGLDFLAYAEERKIPFDKVEILGKC